MNRTLVIGATFSAAILGAGVYLLLQVSAAPVQPEVSLPGTKQQTSTTPSTASPPVAASGDATRPQGPIARPTPVTAGGPSVPEATYEDPEDKPSIDVLRLPDTDPRLTATAAFDEANRAYDRGDFDIARAMANKLLTKNPGNVRLMRIVVSSGCMTGDTSEQIATTYRQLPAADREQMKVRCERYNVHFADQ